MSGYEISFGYVNVDAHASQQNWQRAKESKSQQSNSNCEVRKDSGSPRMHGLGHVATSGQDNIVPHEPMKRA
jgi:hypothetical protein